MIIVSKPEITHNEDTIVCNYVVTDDGVKKNLFFTFDANYEKYLTAERGDAVLVMIFLYAMKFGQDIKMEMPVSERLYYQLNTYLIDALNNEMKSYKKIKIDADVIVEDYEKEPEKEHIVATGMSCGTDSLCTYYTHNEMGVCDGYKINLFTYFNVGAFHYGDGRALQDGSVFTEHLQLTERFAKEVNIPVLVINSNYAELFPMDHEMVDAMRNAGTVLLLQKLIDVYYYSSSYPLNDFHCDPEKGSGYYEIFTLPNVSTNSTVFYSANATYDKVRKTRAIAQFPLAHKYLNVCTVKTYNCGQCGKCTRTLMIIDGIGKLEEFKEVFDIAAYKKKRGMLIGYAWASKKETHFKELVPVLKKEKKIPIKSIFYLIVFKVAKPMELYMRKMSPEKRRDLVQFAERHHIRVPF